MAACDATASAGLPTPQRQPIGFFSYWQLGVFPSVDFLVFLLHLIIRVWLVY